ncbi:MAG: hypothetical protein FGM54_10400 [Chitinophagaceae bacterium]|nr:hypothetical protein [Chitinophagaceae bacterium]
MNLGTLLFCLGLFHPDKIEKQGILLNSACTAFGTKCTGTAPSMHYCYGINESGLRLFIEIEEGELKKHPVLFQRVYQQTQVSLNEPFVLPDEVCRMMNYARGYSLPPGFAKIVYGQHRYRIILIEK